jgi:hypothetical protein
MAFPEINAWCVEAIRFTFFFNEPQMGRNKDWWKHVTGTEPETMINKPQSGEYVESGPYLNGQLELKVVFNRVDVILHYPFASMPDFEPSVNFTDAVRNLRVGINNLVFDVVPTRVAFGTILLHSIGNWIEGNSLISQYLPFVKIDAEKVKDFFLQINVPTKTGLVDGLVINDIVKLGVVNGQFMQMSIGGLPQVTTNYLVRNEVDLSTDGERASSLPADVASLIFDEFIESTFTTLKEGVRL